MPPKAVAKPATPTKRAAPVAEPVSEDENASGSDAHSVESEEPVKEEPPKKKNAPKKAAAPKKKAEEPKEKKPRKASGPRVKMTLELYNQQFEELTEKLSTKIEEKGEVNLRFLISVRKSVKDLQKKASRLFKKKRATGDGTRKAGVGFDAPIVVSDAMRKFLGVSADETLTRGDLTVAVCTYIKRKDGETREQALRWAKMNDGTRNLQDPDNKRNIKPDTTLRKLFNLDQREKDIKAGKVSTKAGVQVTTTDIGYTTLQSLLAQHVVKA